MIMFMFLFLLKININIAFPSGRCYVNNCNASPYNLAWISDSCFVIQNKLCSDTSKYNCCKLFDNLLHKIDISSNAKCNKSVKYVTLNNTIKGGGVSFYIENTTNPNSIAELRISSLRLNNNTAAGTIICIELQQPCNTMELFNSPLYKYAIFDSGTHTCCPTCDFTCACN